MSDREFEVGGKKFKLSKIDAFKQFHIVRRVAPILADLLPAIKEMSKVSKKSAELSESEKIEQFAQIASPLMMGLSKLSDEDSNRVLLGLLSSVEIQQTTGNWTYIARGELLMIQDLELPTLLQIAGRAFMYNLSGFFAVLPQVS